ncbi:MAG: hypothetical protein EX269_10950 [Acidimicrobiales bacterium]|nr:MAG: hypothetical protein EX269_10950 [Acidimicrobiales bacterium]
MAVWLTTDALFESDRYWEANQYWIADIPRIDPDTGETRMEGRHLLIPERSNRAAMARFDHWYYNHLGSLRTVTLIADIGLLTFEGLQTDILRECLGVTQPITRECPSMSELIEEIAYKVNTTGPIEWAAMSSVVELSADLDPGELLVGYFETIDPFDDAGNQWYARDSGERVTMPGRPFTGELLVPEYGDTEQIEAFAAWFDETFTTDPESPFYIFVEKPSAAYRQLLYDSLEFCDAEPDLCGKPTEFLDRTE